ncbi:capsular polysaccharide export protein, LipB/KpsS family [Caenimonas aquaedulcis]|uniref:UDP-glycosyltransferase n=1 Tax=Caenimonas aquaedulcis TaxID=2793270 RepID=A0A931H3J0_9BURK|nr:UDP-glycosyltransferase [Caenimonas aquaedulcis]MBG9387867.1 UDP-glycosyltransferase [Caenimonas aquaedulcis]
MKKVLFVCYGSGHVRMVVPVAKALVAQGLASVQVLGLTTAAPVVRAAGLPLLQIKDFIEASDAAALARGRELVAGMGQVDDPVESAAYLGLSYADLSAEAGEEEAARRHAQLGRQAFLPVRTLRRVLERVKPDLLVVTNSPRAERAAVLAARGLGIPAVCIVDLFAVDEVRWIGARGYAQRICVLNEGVRDFLVAAGRQPREIVVTGNPAFDALRDPANATLGAQIRRSQGWEGRRVLLWPNQAEPAIHPFDGSPGDPDLPARVLQALVDWTLAHPDAVLCVRPRAGEAPPPLPSANQVVVTGQDWALPPLLHTVDAVVTLTSTVGLEGHLCGARLVQVLGSVFDAAMPLARFGVADAAVPLAGLGDALDRWTAAGRGATTGAPGEATDRVVRVLAEFL